MTTKHHVRAAEIAADRAEQAAHRGDVDEAARQAGLAARHATAAADFAARILTDIAGVDATDADRAAERAHTEAASAVSDNGPTAGNLDRS